MSCQGKKISQLPEYLLDSSDGYIAIAIDGVTYKIKASLFINSGVSPEIIFFTAVNDQVVITLTPERIARYGLVPDMRAFVYDPATGKPELTTVGFFADLPYPATTSYTFQNAGGSGYIVLFGSAGTVIISSP